jgi:hypothetical protein
LPSWFELSIRREFLDRRLDGLRVAAQVAHDVGMADQQVDRVADEVRGGLVPGIEEKDAVVDELQRRKLFARFRCARLRCRHKRAAADQL